MKKLEFHEVNNLYKLNYEEILKQMKSLINRMKSIKSQTKLDEIPKSELLTSMLKIREENEVLESLWMPRDNVSVSSCHNKINV